MNEIKNNNLEVENANIAAHQAIEETKQIEQQNLCENTSKVVYRPWAGRSRVLEHPKRCEERQEMDERRRR